MELIKFNFTNILLILGLIALPVAGLLLHLRLHPDIVYLTYILLFDIVIITLLYFSKKTNFYAFILNSVLFAAGVIGHLTVAGGFTDVLLGVPDFVMGYLLWSLNKSEDLTQDSKKNGGNKK